MEEVLRQRLLRRIESLPEAQVYQVLDFIEFLESKYARATQVEPSMLQKFAEGVQDTMRKKAMNPATLREAFQVIAAADRVLGDVARAGKQILDELGAGGETPPRTRVPSSTPGRPDTGETDGRRPPSPPGSPGGTGGVGPGETRGPSGGGGNGEEGDDGEEWTPHRKPSGGGS